MNLGLDWSLRSVELLFLWFLIYSFIGWCSETAICSVSAKKFINRGFLNGPYCPIYGAGAIADIAVLSAESNPVAIFFTGIVLCCGIEYFTSWAMEKLFHARWWDYSNRFLNINGRICLRSALYFGLLSVVGVKVVQPWLEDVTELMDPLVLNVVAGALAAVFFADLVVTLKSLGEFKKIVAEASKLAAEEREKAHELLASAAEAREERLGEAKAAFEAAQARLTSQHRRLMTAFPSLRSTVHEGAVERLREVVRR